MLTLSEKISCECLRVGVLVGDDQYFAGTGNKVDANLSVALALGLSDNGNNGSYSCGGA